jgi:hypothetical protein
MLVVKPGSFGVSRIVVALDGSTAEVKRQHLRLAAAPRAGDVTSTQVRMQQADPFLDLTISCSTIPFPMCGGRTSVALTMFDRRCWRCSRCH